MQVYSNAMKNAPQLTNTWGSVTTILDFIFQDFEALDFSKIETYDNGVAKITYNSTTDPLIACQTINVTGTANYNKQFLVVSLDVTNPTSAIAIVENKSIVKGTETEDGAFKMKIENCKLTKMFGGATDQRIVFKLKNGWHVRIDDRNIGPLLTPQITWNDTHVKFARFAVAEGSNGIDSLTGTQIPYDSRMPTLNINPVNDYVGTAILPYNMSGYNCTTLTLNNASIATNYYRPSWFIVTDENFFWMAVMSDTVSNTAAASTSVRNIMVSEYDSWYSDTGKGISIYGYTTSSNEPKYNSTQWRGNTDSNNVIFKFTNSGDQLNSWVYDDSIQSYITASIYPILNCTIGSGNIISGSSSTSGATVVQPVRNVTILSDTIYTNTFSNPRGTDKYLKWVCTQWVLSSRDYGKCYHHDNERFFIVQQYYSAADVNYPSTAKGLIKLKVPS